MYDKRLLSKIYEELLTLNNKKMNGQIAKLAKDLKKHLTKKDIQISNKHIKDDQHHISLQNCKIKQQ